MKRIYLLTTIFTALTLSCRQPELPQGWALIYGVADYIGTSYDLNYTTNDAQELADLLESQGWNVTLGLDFNADMPSVLTDFDDVRSKIKKDDRFIFYFSGHGVQCNLQGGEPSSAESSSDELLALHGSLNTIAGYPYSTSKEDVLNAALSDDSLAELLSSLNCDNVTVIIDACFSGGFLGDGFTYNGISEDFMLGEFSESFAPAEAFKMYLNYSPTNYDIPLNNFSIITASGEMEESYELSSIQNGVFTYYLLRTPKYADYNNDGYISLIEIYSYTAKEINKSFNNGYYSDYHPHIGAFPVDPVIFKAED